MEELSISKQVQKQIETMGSGVVFGLKDFSYIKNTQAVVLELSRLSKKGFISRLMKGKYFLPKKSKFGELPPDEQTLVNQIILDNGGYLSGVAALNRFGVTSQVPAQVSVRGARSTRNLKIGNLVIRFTRSGNPEAKDANAGLMDLIESVRLIKKTPDGNIKNTLNRLAEVLKISSKTELKNLVEIVKNERPYVRAIIGAQMEMLKIKEAEDLKCTLNPLTTYKLSIDRNVLPNKDEWGIK
jgi:hypothetical protein